MTSAASKKSTSEELATNILRAELTKRGLKLKDLHEKLNSIGVNDSKIAIQNKVNRGTYSFAFFLDCMKALEVRKLDLAHYLEIEEM